MKRIIALIGLALIMVGCDSVVIGTLTPTGTSQPSATLTSTDTSTPTLTVTATENLKATETLEPTATTTSIAVVTLEPTLIPTSMIYIYLPSETDIADDFIVVVADYVNVRHGACWDCPRVQLTGEDTPTVSDDTYEQVYKDDVRVVYRIYYNATIGEIWVQINPDSEPFSKWVSVEPKLCRNNNSSVLINCTEFK